MDPGMIALLTGLVSVLMAAGVVGAGLYGAWALGRARGLRDAQALAPPADARELARLAETVADLSVELERVAESQRYATKLLAERSPKP